MAVNTVYLVTFSAYLLVVLAVGAWGYTRTNDVEDFWVYGRDLGPWLATWSYVANFVSAVAVVGFIGAIYDVGYAVMAGISFGLMLGISCLYFVVHRVRELNHVTLPDIIADVTGKEWSRPVAAVVLLGNAWLYLIMQLVGASILVTTITGVPYRYMVWVLGFVFIAYTVMGGLVSVAWTDLLQGIVMYAMVVLALVYLTFDLGSLTSINTQFAALDAANTAPLGNGVYTVVGIVGSMVAFFGTVFTSQSNIIRINATRDIETAKFHLAAAGVLLGAFEVILVLLGGATSVALHNAGLAIQNTDRAFPVLITEYLPTEVGAFIILAAMSAILSTTDTRLHATGVTTARDIYGYFAPNAPESKQLDVSRYATIFFGLAATVVAVNPPGAIISLYEFRAVLLTCAFLLPVYAGLYWRGVAGNALVASMVSGTIVGVGLRLAGSPFGIAPTIAGVGVAALTLVGGHVLSTEETDEAVSSAD
ncbi:sodium:solute symporter family protein [Haladaptatus caseinilyticus]|uniref:sodium:solute symporter family protein n=1 Tax=Haladaptatus caseinilyticus TaxID=2993314 RepID=UPI00224B892F|nr:sodium:solute symporter family protein [Haladaptatus caseinilyticus]